MAPSLPRFLRSPACYCKRRKLRLERLEDRQMLAADLALQDSSPLDPGPCFCPVCQGLLDFAQPEPAALFGEPSAAPLTDLPQLRSNPAAATKLFLDFDGHIESSWSFYTNVTTPPFDQDGNPSSFSAGELNAIQEIWARVAEDYAPFNVDVTTIDPGHQTNRQVAVVAIGGHYNDWYKSPSGGVAFTNGFSNFSPNVGYVFSQALGNNTRFIAEASSHEAGHLFGLSHQSRWTGTTLTEDYHSGNGAWAPIMGSSYSATRSTWHNGTTRAGPTVLQDDMAIIAGATNGFGYKPDDFGSTQATASPLPVSGTSVSFTGLIGQTDDQDVWSFSTSGGAVSLDLVGAALGANLDAVLELWDSTGAILATNNPTNSLGARITTSLAAGAYFLMARGAGDYGNVGQYTISGSLGASDGTPPTADILEITPDPRSASVSLVTVTFSEPVTGVDLGDFVLTVGGTPISLAGATLSGSGSSYTLDLSAVSGSAGSYLLRLVASGSGITDSSGNPLIADASDGWLTDTTPPSADILDVAPDPRAAAAGLVQVTFSEPVTGFDLGDLSLLRDGAPVALPAGSLTGSGASYSLNLAAVTSVAGAYLLRLNASGSGIGDAAGNALAADAEDTWTVDTTAPLASIASVMPNPRSTAVGQLTITFTEPVTGVGLSDFTLTRGGAPVSLSGVPFAGGGGSYTLDLSAVTAASGAYVLRLTASGSGISDAAGNALAGDSTTEWQTDVTPPTVDIVDVTPDPRSTPAGLVTFTFSEPVTGLDTADLRLTRDGLNVSLAGLVVSGSGATYSIDLTSVSGFSGNYELSLVAGGAAIADAASNALATGASDTWLVENAAPAAAFGDVTPAIRNTRVGVISLVFGEAVTGVDLLDFTLLRNSTPVVLPPAALTGSGAAYTLDLAGLAQPDGVYVLRLVASGSGIIDMAGNALVTDATENWTLDTAAPTLDILDVAPDPRNSPPLLVSLNFSESVTGVGMSDLVLTRDGSPVSLAGATLSGSGSLYTLDLSAVAAADGNYVLRLVAAGSGIVDAAGCVLAADSQDGWTLDTTLPQAAIPPVSPNPRNSPVGAVSFNFSEPVTGFDLGDLVLRRDGNPVSLAGVTLSGIGAAYSVDLTTVTSASAAYELRLVSGDSGIVDAAGNSLFADATQSWLTDSAAPTADIADITPDPRNSPVGVVTITFSEPVTGVDLADFSLTRGGLPVSLAGLSVSGSDAIYTLNLNTVTAATGNYVLRLAASGSQIFDAAGNPLAADATDAWIIDTSGPAADIVDVTPDPRNSPVASVTISFTKPVAGLDPADFRLTRDGVPMPLLNVPFAGAGAGYTLDLSAYTSQSGEYELQLVASGSGVTDSGGNPLTGDAFDHWTIDRTLPTAGILDVTPNVRNTSVGMVTVKFSEPVAGVGIDDFTLTRDGQPVSLAGVPFSGFGDTYRLDLSAVNQPGSYALDLIAAGASITDSAGNPLLSGTTDRWLIDVSNPTAQFTNIPTAPATSALGDVALTFSEPVIGVTLDDFRLWRDGQPINLDNIPFSRAESTFTLDLSSVTQISGAYELRLVSAGSAIIDLAGNPLLADASGSWSASLPAPLADEPSAALNPWHNAGRPLDVDGNDAVTARDALAVINEINGRRLSDPRTARLLAPDQGPWPLFLDANNDGLVTAADCLMIINALNASGEPLLAEPAEQQSALPDFGDSFADPLTPDVLELLAADACDAKAKRARIQS